MDEAARRKEIPGVLSRAFGVIAGLGALVFTLIHVGNAVSPRAVAGLPFWAALVVCIIVAGPALVVLTWVVFEQRSRPELKNNLLWTSFSAFLGSYFTGMAIIVFLIVVCTF
jgi:hypothetical protein